MFADAIISISCKIINNILVRDFKDGQVEVYAPFEMINRWENDLNIEVDIGKPKYSKN